MLGQYAYSEDLRATLGQPRRVRRIASSPRSRVWSADVAGDRVVIKQIVRGGDAAARYRRECAGLRAAARSDPPAAPRLLGVDDEQLLMVQPFVASRRPGADWPVHYATALARLHAAGRYVAPGEVPVWIGPSVEDVDAFLAFAQRMGVAADPTVARVLRRAVGTADLSSSSALLHGDPCPGNDLHTPDGVQFVDFEQAALGDGLVELAYLRIGYPTCWCVTSAPEPLLVEAEDAYWRTWRERTGEEQRRDVVAACVGWLVRGDALVERAERGSTDQLARVVESDWRWGTTSARGRLAYRLEVVGRLTADHREYGRLSDFARASSAAVTRRWPRLDPPPRRRP